MVTSSCHHRIHRHLNKWIYQLYQRILEGTEQTSTPPSSSVVPIDAHSTWQLLILWTPFRSFLAKPPVMVLMPAVSPWCTLIRCYLTDAGTTGCGHKRLWKSPLSGRWKINRWLFNKFVIWHIIYDISVLFEYKIATDQRFVACKRSLFFVTTVFAV